MTDRKTEVLTRGWLWPLAAIFLAGVSAATAAGPDYVGLWDMTTSQGGYFTLLMQSRPDGTVLGTFHNSVPNQAGSWVGLPRGNYLRLTVIEQPGLGLVGVGNLLPSDDGNTFTGEIEESKRDGSSEVFVSVSGTRVGLPLRNQQPRKVNP